MIYKINKRLILEGVLDASKAAFLNGGNISADTIHAAASGNKQEMAKTVLDKSKNKAIESSTGGDVMDDMEKFKANELMNTVKHS